MSAKRTGERNPNWKGGRTVASNGYVLVRVGTDHNLADVRGYAYEHRVVAEEMLGRRLRPGEEVHHRNGNKADNRPENLEVVPDRAHHAVLHRDGSDLRLPGEPNPTVRCACGCGETFPRYDDSGRPREYVSGHNPQPSPVMDAIVGELERRGPLHRAKLARAVGTTLGSVACSLSRMRKDGVVSPIGGGFWELRET